MFNAVVKNLILNATKTCGADIDRVLSFVEEQLTAEDYIKVSSFLNWSFINKKFFGHGNFEKRVAEFRKETA